MLRIEPLEARRPLAADLQLLLDINQTPGPIGQEASSPSSSVYGLSSFVTIGSTAFFSANNGTLGRELWKTNGTEAGTVLVKDIRPGEGSSDPHQLTEFEGVLYFSADDGVGGFELWRSDGSAEGTFMVTDAVPGAGGVYPRDLRNVDGTLFFSADLDWNDRGLWKSDGTEAGTQRIWPEKLKVATILGQTSSELFFQASGALWKTNGSDAGTTRLQTLQDYYVESLGTAGDNFYFVNRASETGPGSLWKSDGTIGGTIAIGGANVSRVALSSSVTALSDNVLLFASSDPVHGHELWRTDGTAAGTMLVKDISPGLDTRGTPRGSFPRDLVAIDGIVYFRAIDDAGYELWRTDGTSAGTLRLSDVGPGEVSHYPFMLNPAAGIVNLDNTLYFSSRCDAGTSLWKSDGTPSGTLQVKLFNNVHYGVAPVNLAVLGDSVLFLANDGIHGVEPWISDGTSAGTKQLKDVRIATAGSAVSQVTEVKGVVYFRAENGVPGEHLWVSDGTAAGTRLVKTINPGDANSSIDRLINVNGTLYFTVQTGYSYSAGELWKSDGTEAGTARVKTLPNLFFDSRAISLANVGDTLYFAAAESNYKELWKSDGTEAGTVMVKQFDRFENFSDSLAEMLGVGEMLYFTANDGGNGMELWRSDGSATGTVMVKNIWSGPVGSYPRSLAEYQGLLYFAAQDQTHGGELWRSDGTEAGTVRVKGTLPSTGRDRPSELVNADGTLYFRVDAELWKSDGTAAGTYRIKNTPSTTGHGRISDIVPVGDKVFFLSGPQLWMSDGSEGGTTLVRAWPYSISAYPDVDNLTAWNGSVYFTANDANHGWELWRSDGTLQGTTLAKEFIEGHPGGVVASHPLLVFNDRLLVVASTVAYGSELWISTLRGPAQSGDYDANGVVDGNDFLVWQRGYGQSAAPAGSGADGDGDGIVDASDLAIWKDHFGESTTFATAAAASARGGTAAQVLENEAVTAADESIVEDFSAAATESIFHLAAASPTRVEARDLAAIAGQAGFLGGRWAATLSLRPGLIERAAEPLPFHPVTTLRKRDAAFAALADGVGSVMPLETSRDGDWVRHSSARWFGDDLEYDWGSPWAADRLFGSRAAPA